MTNNPDAMEEIRKMREKLYDKKTITNNTQKEKGSKFKSPYLAMWASKKQQAKKNEQKTYPP